MIRFKYDFANEEKEKDMGSFKQEKGITLVSLVITIILMLILAGISIFIGTGQMKTVNDSKLTTELEMVQHAVLEQYTKYKTTKDKVYLVGNKITIEEAKQIANELGITLASIPNTYDNKDYYRLDKASLTAIGIQESTDEYIINYISGEVMNITVKKTSSNKPLYIKANF